MRIVDVAGTARRRARRRSLPAVGVLALVLGLLVASCGGDEDPTDLAERGARLFRGEATCATCHGPDLLGTPMGPPLLSTIYAPGHHPDDAIRAAIRNGVQPHHWDFGPMPKLTHLSSDDVDAIIAFVRREQRDNDIS